MPAVLSITVPAVLALITVSSGLAKQPTVRMQHLYANHLVLDQVSPTWLEKAIPQPDAPPSVLNDYPHQFCCS